MNICVITACTLLPGRIKLFFYTFLQMRVIFRATMNESVIYFTKRMFNKCMHVWYRLYYSNLLL